MRRSSGRYDAGAILLGKTNLHELSFGWTSNNLAFGPVRNPYDPARIPGGSSGGTAVAVAAGMAPLGIGEDTCGSIRIPAALCGIVGFRPTTFRYPARGIVPLTSTFDTAGPLARTVADLALFDSVVTGDVSPLRAVSLKGVRLGIPRAHYYADLDPEVERVTDQALARLTNAGAVLVEADVPDLTKLVDAANFPILWHETVPMLSKYLAEFGTGLTFGQLLEAMSSDVRGGMKLVALPGGALYPTEEAYRAARDTYRPALQQAFRRYFSDSDVAATVFPATLVPATAIGNTADLEINGKKIPFRAMMSRNIAPGSCAGIPGLVLPGGLTKAGLPVGLEFDAPAGSDRDLLALGTALETALGRIPAPQI